MYSKAEMVDIINTCWEAVDQSKVGPICVGKNDDGTDKFYTHTISIVQELIRSQVGIGFRGDMTVKEPPESWHGK